MAADPAAGRTYPGGCGSALLLYDYSDTGGDWDDQGRIQSDFTGINKSQ